ncbi:hypothetical protein [Bacteroides sp. An19]|uniref:hypothetical protein n=1 Tax=Bacteroides sp. An19 TaxID=1965580 RepID=UPI000B39E1CB|nr:hypothetical protein [Bacteroides sp. An19]OUP32143.1 hypothetical protein B5F25_09440 [Bacteroides sp. An19]
MFTIEQFTSEWKRLHHPTMNVDGDVAFFYQLYGKLYHLVGKEARCFDSHRILPFLLYIENTIAVGLDGVYEYRYRSVGNVESRWCNGFDMSAGADSEVHNLVGRAVADTKYSALRQWMVESVLSGNFSSLSEMLTWFVREDKVLRQVFPDLRYRKAMFMRLAGNKQAAKKMLWADLAFNWRDKHSCSLTDTIAKEFRYETSFVEKEEKTLLKETAEMLGAIHAERLDTYTVIEQKDDRRFTLRHRDGRVFSNVIFPMSVSDDVQDRHLAAQLVTYNNKTYISGPFVWLTDEALPVWNGKALWNGIQKKEQDAAKQVYFTTDFGKRLSLYEDLYVVPEDPEEAYYADMGIYFDEPNIFDFLGGRPNGRVIYLGS